MRDLSSVELGVVTNVVASGRYDDAVRIIRELTACSEAEAKQAVHQLAAGLGASSPPFRSSGSRFGLVAVWLGALGMVGLALHGVLDRQPPSLSPSQEDVRSRPAAGPRPVLRHALETSQPHAARRIEPVNGELTVDLFRDFQYESKGFPMGLSTGQTSLGELSEAPRERMLIEPEYHSRNHLYGALRLGNGEDDLVSFVVDEMDQPTWVAWVDANNNQDLTDDGPPLPNRGTGALALEVDTMAQVIYADGSGVQVPYRLWLWVKDKGPRKLVHAYSRCYYKGVVRVGRQDFTAVAFERQDHDGLFRGSGLFIDLDGNGKLDEQTEHFLDGAVISVNGQDIRLKLAYP